LLYLVNSYIIRAPMGIVMAYLSLLQSKRASNLPPEGALIERTPFARAYNSLLPQRRSFWTGYSS
jgi:hypothetical protein